MRLNQIIAIVEGIKTRADKVLTGHYHLFAKTSLINGQTRVYMPDEDEGEKLPSENQNVQLKVEEGLKEVQASLNEWFNAVFTQESGNTAAFADVVVEGEKILEHVPVTYLLFLEKRLIDVRTLISKLPTLDPTENWSYNANKGLYQSEEVRTARNKTLKEAIVLYPATDKHPAQTQLIDTIKKAGEWSTVKLSSALPTDKVKAMLQRVELLQKAVKLAREEANSLEIQQRDASSVLKYIFG